MKSILEKGVLTMVITWIGIELGLLLQALTLLTILMILDYISGMLAFKKEALEHPNSKKYGWSSKKGIIGIYKKMGYVLTIIVTLCIDYLFAEILAELGFHNNQKTFFGLLAIVWFIINEMLSILENAGRMGVILPKFLTKVLAELHKEIDDPNEG